MNKKKIDANPSEKQTSHNWRTVKKFYVFHFTLYYDFFLYIFERKQRRIVKIVFFQTFERKMRRNFRRK